MLNERDINQVDNLHNEGGYDFSNLVYDLSLTDEQLEAALINDDWAVRSTAILSHISRMSDSQINRAIADESEFVRGDIFSCGDVFKLSYAHIELGIRDRNYTVRSMVAEYCPLDSSQISMLIADKSWVVRRAIVRRFQLSADQALNIIKNEKSFKVRKALYEYLCAKISEKSKGNRHVSALVDSLIPVERVGGFIGPEVKKHIRKVARELEKALTHPDFEVRSEALYLHQEKLSTRQLKRAMNDKCWAVVSCVVITNRDLLAELLEQALTSPHPYIRACGLKRHFLTEAQVARGLSDENFICRIMALHYGPLSQSQISTLMCDPHHEVRQQVAMTCQLTDDQRVQFDKDEAEYQKDNAKLSARFCDDEMDKSDYSCQLYNISLRGPDEIEVMTLGV